MLKVADSAQGLCACRGSGEIIVFFQWLSKEWQGGAEICKGRKGKGRKIGRGTEEGNKEDGEQRRERRMERSLELSYVQKQMETGRLVLNVKGKQEAEMP